MMLKLPRISTDLRVALLYAAFGGLWIALSDRILATLARDVAALTIMQTYKGWAFVVISAALIYSLLRRDLALRNRAENTLRASERAYQTLANISPGWRRSTQTIKRSCAGTGRNQRRSRNPLFRIIGLCGQMGRWPG